MGNESARRFAVVTGASSGIGFALARQCLQHDFDVLACAEDAGIVDAVELLAGFDGSVQPVRADLATAAGCETLCRVIADSHRPIDALLVNAGVGVGGAFLHTSLDDEIRMIELSCMHTVRLAKALVPDMVRRGHGRVAIAGSVVSTAPAPYAAVYGATRAFVMSFGQALREELEDTGVTVTVIAPGATDTDLFARAGMAGTTPVGDADRDDPDGVARRGFDAMMAGKDAVLAGEVGSRLHGMANEILPEPTKARAEAKRAKPEP
jgi:uncharacterized protein